MTALGKMGKLIPISNLKSERFFQISMVLLGSLIGFIIIGCSRDAERGPIEIAWDRDTCEYCRMVISDRAYATQIRDSSSNKNYKFDDLGCALNWLHEQGWGDKATEIWVADHRQSHEVKWLEAQTAQFVLDQTTPMDYGFGAVSEVVPGSIDFLTAQREILNRNASR